MRPFLSRQAIELPGFEDIAHLRARASNRIFNGDVPAACCAIFAVMDGRQIFKTAACIASKIRPLGLANTRRRELGKHGASILLADLKTRIADQLGLIHDGFCVGVRAWRELRKLALAAAGQNEADAAWLHHAVRFTDAARAVARLSTTVDRDIAAANAAANGGGSQDPGTAQLAAARADELERLERRAERLGRVEADARLARDAARARDNLPVATPEEATMAALSPPLRAHVIAGRKQREAEMLADPSLATHDCPLPPAPPELRAECRAHLEGKPCRKLDDMRNAFGLVSRRWVLRLMMAVCPQFVHGFLALYGSETLVFTTRGTALWLSTGFAQGDPLANPGFALPAWFVARLVRLSGCRPVMYWDDTATAGELLRVASAEHAIVSWENETGLQLRPDKCHAHVESQIVADLAQLAAVFSRGDDSSYRDWTRVHAGFDMVYLNSLVGCDVWAIEWLQTDYRASLEPQLARLAQYAASGTDRRHRAYRLLRSCLSAPKTTHFARALPTDVCEAGLLGWFDDAVRHTAEAIFDVERDTLSEANAPGLWPILR